MTLAYFDCFSGISGDMALGALIDCGVPVEVLREGLASLPVSGWHLEAQPILQNGLHAMDVTISLDGVTDAEELQQLQHEAAHHSHEPHAHGHHHDHHHHHDDHDHHGHHHHEHHEHEHHHGHHHEPGEHDSGTTTVAHTHTHSHGRSMAEIRSLIEASDLSERVKKASLDIFWRIAEAEAHIHHTTPEEIHFHEIGGIDSLIDICGVAWCLEYLGVDAVHCSALPYSTGFVDCAHGRVPVPAPATLELLKGVPLVPTEVRGEMVTPTGAGIIAALSQSFGTPPAMTPQHIGVGSGKKRFEDRPNVLRVIVGQASAQLPANAEGTPAQAVNKAHIDGLEWKTLALVETNIDDMNPELFQYVFERLFKAGAVDVWLQPIQMKKNRPAWLLGALCHEEDCNAVITTILRETTTLGVRVSAVSRAALAREIREVDTAFGRVKVKVAQWPEQQLLRAAPEYDDVERLAAQHNVAAREVYEAAVAAAQRHSHNIA